MAALLRLARALSLAVLVVSIGMAAPAAAGGPGAAPAATGAGRPQAGANAQQWPPLPAYQVFRQAAKAAARGGKAVADPDGQASDHDASVYLTPRYVPKNDLLEAYSVDKAPQAKADGVPVPGLLGIATQAYRANHSKLGGTAARKTYSLADAMRDAVWRKKTAAKLKNLFR
ncbi:MAG: hypothetical protein ACE5KF_07290 [Kiloniellaceae bacterium]